MVEANCLFFVSLREMACQYHASRPPLTPPKGRGRNPSMFQSRTRVWSTFN